MGKAANLSLSSSTKKWAEQNEMSMEAMDTNEVKPNKSLLGKLVPKSFSWYLDVRMARNMTKEVTEKQSATRDEMAKQSNAGLGNYGFIPKFQSDPSLENLGLTNVSDFVIEIMPVCYF